MYQVFVRIVGRYAPIITFPVAVVLGVIGYNLESILVKTSIISDRKDVDAERGITEKREERLLLHETKRNDDNDEANIYTQRNNMFDKNDAKHLKK
jgi:hypothetical protein